MMNKMDITPLKSKEVLTVEYAKRMYSEGEVIQLLRKLAEDIDQNYSPYTYESSIGFDMVNNDGKWIEENL